MPDKHAMLSASSAHMWIPCPPSARLNAAMPEVSNKAAAEGTDAHSLCEYRLKKALGIEATDPTENLTYFSGEMSDYADDYVSYVMGAAADAKSTCKDPIVLIEQRLDFSRWVPGGFGTGDCVIVADETLDIIDFKYGLGVLVDAEANPQMACYALGALALFDRIYDIDTVRMTIFQPRREHISTFTTTKDKLLEWADKVLSPAAALAANGEGDFKAGEHCQFCKVKATCRKRAKYNLELAKYDFAPPDTLDNTEIAAVLEKADALISWAGDVKEYALKQALSGISYPGFKIVEGRSNRKYTDEKAVAAAVSGAGFDPFEKRLLGLTDMTKLLGKKRFEELLGGLIYKPRGKPVLVPESDKRPARNTAQDDFNENLGGN